MNTAPSALISLDFDGTCVETDGKHFWFSDLVATELNDAAKRGAVWCSNSGRGASSQISIVQACRALESMPIAVLSAERHIHHLPAGSSILVPKQPYNDEASQKAKAIIAEARERIPNQLLGSNELAEQAHWSPDDDSLAWLVKDAADVAAFVEDLKEALSSVANAQILQNGCWVVVTHADFGKGVLLEVVAAEIHVRRQCILAIGDQQNDLDMLDGRVAAYVGCPADADPLIIEAVQRAGGWVSEHAGATGTAGLLRRFVDLLL